LTVTLSLAGCSGTHAVPGETVTIEGVQEIWFGVEGKYHALDDFDIRLIQENAACRASKDIVVENSNIGVARAEVDAGMSGATAYRVPPSGGLKLTISCIVRVPQEAQPGYGDVGLFLPGAARVASMLGATPMSRDLQFAPNGYVT
jgi:hypothetical protein